MMASPAGPHSLLHHHIPELVGLTHAMVLTRAKTACLSQGDSFPSQISVIKNKADAETGTAHVLFNGQRMGKQEPGR